MANPNADFSQAGLTQPVHTDPYVLRKAASNLRRLHGEGKLQPLHGWDGDTLEGYMDLLGLNGRPIRMNRTGQGLRI